VRKSRRNDAWVVVSTFRPGEKGTKRLLRDWGARLVCVRYRYNAQRKTRVKTAEIVIDEVAWTRKADAAHGIEIRSWEGTLREAIVAAGGRWDRELRVWVLSKGKVDRLGLARRAKRLQQASHPPIPAPKHPSEVNIAGNREVNAHGNVRRKAASSGNLP
jgi:hypothetical protein